MELIDKQKLLEWLNRNVDANQLSQGGIALKILREKVVSGTFDDHSGQEEIAKLRQIRQNVAEAHADNLVKLEARAIQAEQERDELQETLFYEKRAVEEWHGNAVRYMEERNALLEGLKWYADGQNYEPHGYHEGLPVLNDNGALARSIIAKIERSNP